ncbi:hypothetical protein LOK49_LG02G00923 [Camellia lanceoleosa]|uniref:Uncharacterized protein n=1 Tax=Camellia lanceoleosa TaxID=1840588 RepID=A0ACC0IHY3_9ERIC|nr:hypothetical protein LOK49_LG02G00923 [Camellia lanceoleosa]
MLLGLDFFGFYDGTSIHWKLMDWKDNVVMVVCGPGNPCVDVWMIEDCCGTKSNWCKLTVIGPVLGVEPFWLLQCMKSGEIIVEDAWGRIFLYNSQNGEAKYILIDRVQFKAFHYVESNMTLDVHFQKDLALDSFDNVEIVLALEEEFELKIPNKETNKIDSCFLAIE